MPGTVATRRRVILAYTPDSRWRNRSEFLHGRAEIEAFLTRKWQRELDYRLIKEVWAFRENRIAVRFAYEWHDDDGDWFRSYGNENWEFADDGLMAVRIASINDLAIAESDRKYHWPLGRRPDDHPSLTELGSSRGMFVERRGWDHRDADGPGATCATTGPGHAVCAVAAAHPAASAADAGGGVGRPDRSSWPPSRPIHRARLCRPDRPPRRARGPPG